MLHDSLRREKVHGLYILQNILWEAISVVQKGLVLALGSKVQAATSLASE